MRLFQSLCIVISAVAGASAAPRLQKVDPGEFAHDLFESASDLNQLDCTVVRQQPQMGIDLRFHTGYVVSIPARKLVGGPGEIRTLLRVTPVGAPERRVFFSMTTPTPALGDDAGGDVELAGSVAVGPGRYKVDWALSFAGAVCRKQWKIEAKLKSPFSLTTLAIAAETTEELPPDPFADMGETASRGPHPLHVKVLVNFSPAGINDTVMDGDDVRVIVAMLRAVAREPRFGRFSLVAFSSDQERILARQAVADKIDYHALRGAVQQLRTGVVSIRQMEDPQSGARFLDSLLRAELRSDGDPPDVVVVISPKLSNGTKLPEREVTEEGALPPVFLLSYNPHPVLDPWQGVLVRAVKRTYRGLAFTISRPQDLGKALLKMNSRIAPRP